MILSCMQVLVVNRGLKVVEVWWQQDMGIILGYLPHKVLRLVLIYSGRSDDFTVEKPRRRQHDSVSIPRSACVRSRFSRVCLFETLWTVAPRLLCPWISPGKNPGVGGHAFPCRSLKKQSSSSSHSFSGLLLSTLVTTWPYISSPHPCTLLPSKILIYNFTKVKYGGKEIRETTTTLRNGAQIQYVTEM